MLRSYSKQADWGYIGRCADAAPDLQFIGNGDIMSYTDYNARLAACPRLATVMLARGALVKPWLFTEVPSLAAFHACMLAAMQIYQRTTERTVHIIPEVTALMGSPWLQQSAGLTGLRCVIQIKEQRHWDISGRERLDLLRDFCAAGLLHWGSDSRGVETTRCGSVPFSMRIYAPAMPRPAACTVP
jgi:tRNA-dihydrouridine synthase 3